MSGRVVVVGAGIVGISAAIWLRRLGAEVVVIDRAPPGRGTSFGNAGVLAACSIAPVTAPGLARRVPGLLMDPSSPLFLRWRYLPRLAPWLRRYLGHANDADTRRIASALTPIVSDAVEQHAALARGTGAERWLAGSDYHFAYADRAAFEADAYVWGLRREAGFEPVIREGAEVRAREPSLSRSVGCLATVGGHGSVRDPGAYVEALAHALEGMGGVMRRSRVLDLDLAGGRIAAVVTEDGPEPCEAAVLATGAWSKPLMRRLGIDVPLESERGYHILFEGAEGGPTAPTMIAAGKFVATPMARGLRCAGLLEFGGLEAGPSRAPLALLRREALAAFPGLRFRSEEEWMGHRPAPADSLPLIGEVGSTGVHAAFGHHHVGLTGGPKTGRLVAEALMGQASPSIDMAPYSPGRFAAPRR